MRRFFKLLAVIIVCVMAVSSVSITGWAAETPMSFTVFEGSKLIDGWFPAFVSSWQNPGSVTIDQLKAALDHPYATIELVYSGNATPGLLLQSNPVSGGTHYTWATDSDCEITVNGDRKTAVFSAQSLVNKYTSTKHQDDGSYLSLDNLLNFSVGGEGNTVYSIVVKWIDNGTSKIIIDPSSRHQTIAGWGASYTWYGDWLVNNIHAEQGYDWIFEDAEFNILRFRDLNMVRGYGGGYESTEYKAYKAYYDAAVKRGIDPIVLVTSWGQYDRNDCEFVAFTERDNNGYTYYTLAKDQNGEYMYEELAQFCVESVKLFLKAGIPVDYFSISNETELQGLGRDEQGNARDEAGFYFGAEENEYHCAYWKAHVAVYEAFQEAFGDDAPIITAAEVMADRASLIKEYLDPLFENGYGYMVELIAHHLYGSENSKASFAEVYELFGDYELWQTEWYNNDFLDHADKLINELNYENITAYLYWNGVWIEDTANCLIQVNGWDSISTIERRANHYAMTHFSKYIKPGYVRLDSDVQMSNCNVTAFISPEGDKLVAVVLNKSGIDENLSIDCGFDISSASIYQSTFNSPKYVKPSDGSLYRDDILMNKYLVSVAYSGGTVAFPNNTLTTIVMDIVPAEGDINASGSADDVDAGLLFDHIVGRNLLDGSLLDRANVYKDGTQSGVVVDLRDFVKLITVMRNSG